VKRIAPWLIILGLLLTACTGGAGKQPGAANPPATNAGESPKPPAETPAQPAVPKADAQAALEAYLQALLAGSQENAAKRLVPAARQATPADAYKRSGYQITGATETTDGWRFDVTEAWSDPAKTLSAVVPTQYLVVREGTELLVDRAARRAGQDENFAGGMVSVAPLPDAPKQKLQLSKGSPPTVSTIQPLLPQSFRPYGAGADILFGVGQEGWGALALSPNTKEIAFVTRGTHPLLGLVNEQGSVTGLDLWFEGGAGELAWSFDGKYLAATNASPRGVLVLAVWDLTAKQPVTMTGLPDGQDITNLQWIGNKLHFRAGTQQWSVELPGGTPTPS